MCEKVRSLHGIFRSNRGAWPPDTGDVKGHDPELRVFVSSWWIGPVFTTSVFICGSFVLIARGQAAHPFLQLLHVLGYSPGPREQDGDQHNPQPGYHVHGLM